MPAPSPLESAAFPEKSTSEHDGDIREHLLIAMARALATYGTPAHRLEASISGCARQLGLVAATFATPTAVFLAIGPERRARTVLLRVEPTEVNLARLRAIDDVRHAVGEGGLDAREGLARLEALMASQAGPPRWLMVLSTGLIGGAAGRFFGGGGREMLAASIIGLVVGLLLIIAGRWRRFARVIEFTAGVLATVIAGVLARWMAPLDPLIATLGGIIVLIPGLTLTLSVAELATRNLVAGTARLTGAITAFISIGFGVAIGSRIVELLPAIEPAVVEPLPGWTLWASVVVAPFLLTVLFQARPRDLVSIVPSGVIAFAGAWFGAMLLGPELGVGVGAFIVAVAANLYARIAHAPAAVPLLPGIMLLVPGGIGFRSLSAFLADQTIAGVQVGFSVAMIAVALVAGLLFANVIVRTDREL